MKTISGIKAEKIGHLEYCLEKLRFKENTNNEEEIEQLYRCLYRVVSEMRLMEAGIALEFYKTHITDEVRNALLKYNVELIV